MYLQLVNQDKTGKKKSVVRFLTKLWQIHDFVKPNGKYEIQYIFMLDSEE